MARKCKTTLALLLCLLFCFQLLPVSAYAEDKNVSVVANAGDTKETITDEDVASVYVQATGEGSKASAEVGTGSGTAVTGAVNVIAQDGGNASAKIDGDVGGEHSAPAASGVTVVVTSPPPAPPQPSDIPITRGPAPGDSESVTVPDSSSGEAEVTVTGNVYGYLDVCTDVDNATATGTVGGSVLMYDDDGTYANREFQVYVPGAEEAGGIGKYGSLSNISVLAAGDNATANVDGDAYSVGLPYQDNDWAGLPITREVEPGGAASLLGGEVTVGGDVAAVGGGEGGADGNVFAILDQNNPGNRSVALGTFALDGTVNVGESVTAISPDVAVGAVGIEGLDDYVNIILTIESALSGQETDTTLTDNPTEINIGGDLQVIGSTVGLGSAMIGGSTLNVEGDVYVGGKDVNSALDAIAAAYQNSPDAADVQTAIVKIKDNLEEKGYLRVGVMTMDVIEPARTLLDSGVLEEILGEELYGMLESTGALDMMALTLLAFSEDTVPSVTVGGDVTVEDARLAVGLVGNGNYDVGGTVSVSGNVAGGAILIGSNFPAEGAAGSDTGITAFQTVEPTMATAKLHAVTVEGGDVAFGVAAIYGAAQIDGNIEASGENALGILQTASDVRVNGDVTVESDGSEKDLGATGAAFVNVGDVGDALYDFAFQFLNDMLASENPTILGAFADAVNADPELMAYYQDLSATDPEAFQTLLLAETFGRLVGVTTDVDPDTGLPTGDPYILTFGEDGDLQKIPVDPAKIVETALGLASEKENVLVVDGTISADYGLMVVDKVASAGLVFNALDSIVSQELDNALAMLSMQNPELADEIASVRDDDGNIDAEKLQALVAQYNAALQTLDAQVYSGESKSWSEDQWDSYYTMLANLGFMNQAEMIYTVLGIAQNSLTTYSQQEDVANTLPDVTVWKIQTTDEHNNIVRSGAVSVTMEELIGSVLTEEELAADPTEFYDIQQATKRIMGDVLSTNLDEDYANEVENNIHYMVRVNSIKDTDGNELDLSALSFVREDGQEAMSDHQGFLTAKMGTYTIKAANAEYEIESLWNGEGSEDDGYGFQAMRAESSYNLARGGGILINAVLKLITPEPEPQPEPEPEPEPKPEEAEEAATPVKGLTWAAQIRASAKNARLTFDGTYMEHTLFNICGDYAQAIKERPDVTVTIVFMDNGERVSITIEPNTDVVGALAKEDLTDHDEIAFPKLAELLELTPEAFQG